MKNAYKKYDDMKRTAARCPATSPRAATAARKELVGTVKLTMFSVESISLVCIVSSLGGIHHSLI